MKLTAAALAIVGVALLILAAMTYVELRGAASGDLVSADSMPMTRIVGPEFFETPADGDISPRPTDLARIVLSRIYGLGGVGLLMIVASIFLTARPSRRQNPNETSG